MIFIDITNTQPNKFNNKCKQCVFVANYLYKDLNFVSIFDLYYCLKTKDSNSIELISRYGNNKDECFTITLPRKLITTSKDFLHKHAESAVYHWYKLASISLERFLADNHI